MERLAISSVVTCPLLWLFRSLGAHWLYYGRQKGGQSYRFFGLASIAAIVMPYLTIAEQTAVAVTCHDCNAVSHLGIYWKEINATPPLFPLER
jgi:hypothetical protein